MTNNQLTEQQIDLLIENGYDIAHTLENLAENEINSDCFEVFSYSENGRETEWDGKITEFAQRAAKAIRHLTYATTALQAELQERRKADSEPVAEVVSIYGDPEAFGEREIRPLVGIQQMPYGTKLYRHAQPVPEYPEVLPCPVLLEPGLRFGKGIKTSTMLAALARRAVYESDMAALSPEERAEFQAGIEDFKALIAQPAPVVPDDVLDALQKVARIRLDLNDFDGDRRGIADCLCDAEEVLIEVVNRRAAMLAAAPQSPGSEPATVPGKWIPVSERLPDCWCLTCRPVVLNDMRFVLCPDCGNKRCPRANDHRNACTGSNEPGQEGGAYPDTPQEVKP
ncbi:Uncharacterised protein [Klebsiella quasivariicola]|uniref:DUF551 domain-containing protein n=1 Tax=Klebsiella quasivariicola TaxID=2026240 RepID=A0ABY6WTS6_9ENTR|nr:hypothetical protein [Klebsiella quasivariicola]VVJ56056.1 Uncharacterised protein [Klebsiella quasivariicola]